jgi:NADPH:quinone reductase
MKAGWFEEFGTAEEVLRLGEQPTPQPSIGQVLVCLKTSAVNPSDVKKRAGSFPDLLDDGLVIPNSDGAGVIVEVGEGVTENRIGERVWIYQAQYARRFGTTAQYIALDSSRAVVLPDNTAFDIGACLGIPVMTAHRCVFADGAVTGQTLLITGGAGRVGYYAIQWAKLAGAKVIATASNSADSKACRDVGADAVVNHHDEDWAQQVLTITSGDKVDRVIEVEFGVNLPQVMQLIRIGGTIATYSSSKDPEPTIAFVPMMFKDLTIRMVVVYAMPEQAKQDAIKDISRCLQENTLQHRIAHRVSLAEHAHAHRLIERGGLGGCVIIDIDPDSDPDKKDAPA